MSSKMKKRNSTKLYQISLDKFLGLVNNDLSLLNKDPDFKHQWFNFAKDFFDCRYDDVSKRIKK